MAHNKLFYAFFLNKSFQSLVKKIYQVNVRRLRRLLELNSLSG